MTESIECTLSSTVAQTDLGMPRYDVLNNDPAEILISAAMDSLRCQLLNTDDEAIWSNVPKAIFERIAPARVNITVRVAGVVRASMSGAGDCLGAHVRGAVRNCLLDERYGRLVRADAKALTMELWIQVDSTPIAIEDRCDPLAIDLGHDGVEIEWNDAFAYYKPSVAFTSDFKSAPDMFSALCRKAGLFDTAWKLAGCRVSKTSWNHLSKTGRGISHLRGLRSVASPSTSLHSLKVLVARCTNYLLESQHADGSYCYMWNPLSAKQKRHAPNSVRAAGCAYAMAQVAHAGISDQPSAVFESARRSLMPLLAKRQSWRDGELVCEDVGANGVFGKLGTTALLAATLARPGIFDDLCDIRDALFRTIVSSQRIDGSFQCNLGSNRPDGGGIEFYPGEALVALGILGEHVDQFAFETMERAFPFYRHHFQTRPTTAFVGWHADAWSRAFRLCGDSKYATFVFEQIDWLIAQQVTDSEDPHIQGGFVVAAGKRPNVTSVVYTEAVLRGMSTAMIAGEIDRFNQYKLAAKEGLQFCLQLILGQEQAAFVTDPDRCQGGVTKGFHDFNIRSDHVQHTLTLLLTALELIGPLHH